MKIRRGGEAVLHGERARAAPARREESAGGVVVRSSEDGPLFLLIRDPYRNWGLPKGHVEFGESPQAAAQREIAEETGLRGLEPLGPLATIDWHFQDGSHRIHKFCHFFLFDSPEGEARPLLQEGISECVWLPFPAALARITYDNAREVLRAAGRRLALDAEPAP